MFLYFIIKDHIDYFLYKVVISKLIYSVILHFKTNIKLVNNITDWLQIGKTFTHFTDQFKSNISFLFGL